MQAQHRCIRLGGTYTTVRNRTIHAKNMEAHAFAVNALWFALLGVGTEELLADEDGALRSAIQTFGFPSDFHPGIILCINHYLRNLFKTITQRMKGDTFLKGLTGIGTPLQLWRLSYNIAAALRLDARLC